MLTFLWHFCSKFGNSHCIQHSKLHMYGKFQLPILSKGKTIIRRNHLVGKNRFQRKRSSNIINRNRPNTLAKVDGFFSKPTEQVNKLIQIHTPINIFIVSSLFLLIFYRLLDLKCFHQQMLQSNVLL